MTLVYPTVNLPTSHRISLIGIITLLLADRRNQRSPILETHLCVGTFSHSSFKRWVWNNWCQEPNPADVRPLDVCKKKKEKRWITSPTGWVISLKAFDKL
jgi:hypothetical protein